PLIKDRAGGVPKRVSRRFRDADDIPAKWEVLPRDGRSAGIQKMQKCDLAGLAERPQEMIFPDFRPVARRDALPGRKKENAHRFFLSRTTDFRLCAPFVASWFSKA